jgi:hypothetical protein
MIEKIKSILKESQLTSLYHELIKFYNIEFKENITSKTWRASIVDEHNAVIEFSNTKYPNSCLAHELLHLKIQTDGYKIPSLINTGKEIDNKFAKLVKDFSEELMHHKIYPMFIKLGFPKEEFYHDDDVQQFEFLEKHLSFLRKQTKHGKIDLSHLVSSYLTIISVGGAIPDIKMIDMRRRFMYLEKNILLGVEKIINDWKNEESLDSTNYIKRLFLLLGCNDKFWVSLSDKKPIDLIKYPEDGFFISS